MVNGTDMQFLQGGLTQDPATGLHWLRLARVNPQTGEWLMIPKHAVPVDEQRALGAGKVVTLNVDPDFLYNYKPRWTQAAGVLYHL